MDFRLDLRQPVPPPLLEHRPNEPDERSKHDGEANEHEHSLQHLLEHSLRARRRPVVDPAYVLQIVSGIEGDLRVLGKEGPELRIGFEEAVVAQKGRVEHQYSPDRRRVPLEQLHKRLPRLLRVHLPCSAASLDGWRLRLPLWRLCGSGRDDEQAPSEEEPDGDGGYERTVIVLVRGRHAL